VVALPLDAASRRKAKGRGWNAAPPLLPQRALRLKPLEGKLQFDIGAVMLGVEMPYERIVVGTDGSGRASAAVEESLALAKAYGATVHAVTAVGHTVAAGFADSRAAQFQVNETRTQVEQIEKNLKARAEGQGVQLEFHTPGAADPADAILEIAKAVDADLVVVGNRGMTGMKRFVLGSVPNKISHQCPCSVLIVNTDSD
jgi:nucleotide-binding universal stress UspA family protein